LGDHRRQHPLELRQYLDILKRHKWFILEAIVVVGLAAGILSSLRTPLYKATARVLLTPNDPNQQLNPMSGNGVVGNDPDRYVAGQITIAESEGVAAEAVKSLQGVSAASIQAKVSVTQSGQSNVLNVSATGPDPAAARDIADAVAKGYIENRRKAAVSGLQGAADDIQAKLGPLQTQIAQFDAQIGDGSTIAGASSTLVSPVNPGSGLAPAQPASQVPPATSGLGGAATTQEALKAARYAAAVQYETLYSRQQELLVDISLKRGDAELIAEAKTPTIPVSPRPKRDAAFGLFLGFLLGVGVSFLREQLNDKIRSSEEVERLTGLPLLAQLPFDQQAATDGISVEQRPNSPLSEAMRSLRTSIQYQGVDRPVRVIVVTSALPGEGKSLVAANLAAAFAQADYRTILVSADLRRPSVDGLFGDVKSSPGLMGVLRPGAPLADSVAGSNGHSNGHSANSMERELVDALVETPVNRLRLLPSGPTPPNPAEMLGSKRMAAILAQLSSSVDIVIIDSPPLLPVTDAAVLSSKCDGVMLVTASNETPRAAVIRSKMILDGTGARILGVVVNKSRKAGLGYYYSGYYGESGSQVKTKRRRLGAEAETPADALARGSSSQ
jgi:Mrp family chromosome partitioning ATPase